MTNSQRLATVRELLRLWLAGQHSEPESRPENGEAANDGDQSESATDTSEHAAASIAAEAILIREGYYAGRTFELLAGSEHMRAVWFMEQDELKIRDTSGSMVAAYCGDEIDAAISSLKVAAAVEAEHEEVGPVSIPISAGEETAPVPAEAAPQDDQDSGDDSLPKAA